MTTYCFTNKIRRVACISVKCARTVCVTVWIQTHVYHHLRQLSDDSPGASSAHSFLTSSRHAFAAATSLSQNEWISTCKCADADAESAHADLVTPRDKRELAYQCSLHVTAAGIKLPSSQATRQQ